MKRIEAAILRTLLYGDIFQFPMTPAEIHRYLIARQPVTLPDIQHTLTTSETLHTLLHCEDNYITLREHAHYIELRKEREAHSQALWDDALRYGRWLAWLPFVQMVALTGALCMRNPASDNDDLDYLLVTKPGRVWLARLLAIVLVRLVRLRGRELCPNYVVAADKLKQHRQDLYMAHEVVQMRPLYGQQLYQKMLQYNNWTRDFLPNACPMTLKDNRPGRSKKVFEWLLGGTPGDWLETWEFRRKQRKFASQTLQADPAARVTSDEVKGHFQDNGQPVMVRYRARLQAYGLTDDI
jgi:hypothetical protein